MVEHSYKLSIPTVRWEAEEGGQPEAGGGGSQPDVGNVNSRDTDSNKVEMGTEHPSLSPVTANLGAPSPGHGQLSLGLR